MAAHPPVPCVSDLASPAACVVACVVAVLRIEARSPVANRPWIAAVPNA
jgi:hypothetical protein